MRARGFLLLGLVAAACAAPEANEVEIAEGALVAGRNLIGPVEVHADRLLVQRAGNEALALGAQGRVLVGADSGGFLRRALSSRDLGDRIEIMTEPAALGDVIQSGSVHVSDELPLETDLRPQGLGAAPSRGGIDVTVRDKTLLDFRTHFEDPTGLLPNRSFDIARTVRLTQGHVSFAPAIDLDLEVSRGKVTSFDAVARGALEASFDLTIDTTTSIEIDKNPAYYDTLQRYLRSPGITVNLFESKPWVLPVQWVGFVPVVETVRFRVVLECDVEMNSQSHTDASLRVSSTAAFGARYRHGTWQSAESPTFQATPSVVTTKTGRLTGICGIRTEVGFYFYDLAGPTLSVTPYSKFEVTSVGTAWGFEAWPGFRGAFGGRVQVLGWELARGDVVLFDARAREPLRGSL